ncbi:Glycerol-3-phosphate dehydrogenase NAD-dependent [Botryosphaeria dothidea]|uniref:Glycerol-3-phosphate dehydrogenase NAD-dependent n=1 Tax=Botryosphaeria dothidea TaxID=55169 RepID=A0A8H4IWR7_9PEZI|nr:Glycerol-3-phosphate dehydrogenase NAD-dependent [Botryosphaeria dothidea]
MRFSTFFAVSAFTGFAVAQSSTSSAAAAETTVSDPSTVEASLRNTWCRAQQQSCPTLCGGDTANNTCDSTTLEYNCTCTASINLNVSDFTQTLPSLECQYAVAQCTADHPDDAEGQATCQSVSCGSKNVTSQVESSSSSASASATASSTGSSSGSASATSATAASTTSADSSASIKLAKNYGSGALVAGLLALFGFAL